MPAATTTCSTCGASFACGLANGEARCWCGELPRIVPLEAASSCLCPPCLKADVSARIARFVRSVSPEAARAGAGLPYAAEGPLLEGLDYTLERGQMVFSAWYLLKRGHCCESGCRNCPYGFGGGKPTGGPGRPAIQS